MSARVKTNTILNSCKDLYKYLQTNNVNNPFTLYSDKIILERETFPYGETENICHSIRIWKSKTLFNSWFNNQSSSAFIGALDYQIRPNDIRIEYLSVNDEECPYIDKPIDLAESRNVHKELLEYAKKLAKDENKDKVIIDVHGNLRIYNKFFKDEGFQITGRKASDNPFWQEVEFTLPKDT